MKRILGIIALAIAVGLAFTGCNNRPPFEKLAASVDSLNTYYTDAPMLHNDSTRVTYDEITNTVEFHMYAQGYIDKAQLEAVSDRMADSFTDEMVRVNRFNFGKELLAAKANVLLDFKGSAGGEYQLLIENKAFQAQEDAYNVGK